MTEILNVKDVGISKKLIKRVIKLAIKIDIPVPNIGRVLLCLTDGLISFSI
nr:hypothetical protein BN993_00514 [Virgibacillus halodenitrificans]